MRDDQIETLIFPRIITQIIHEAKIGFDEGLATKEGIDLAMKNGLNYPLGPFEWNSTIGNNLSNVLLTNLAKNKPYSPNRYTR